MEKRIIKLFIFIVFAALYSCEKKDSFPGATLSPYIALFDLRSLSHNINDVVELTTDKMSGADSITGIVITDHSANNFSDSLLVLQDRRRLSMLRGIAVIVPNASDFKTGDSIVVKVKGGTLKRKDGLLQIVGIKPENVRKVGSNKTIDINQVPIDKLLANPDVYECTQISVVKGGPNPMPDKPTPLSGTMVINDSYGNMNLVTAPNATFADSTIPVLANYTGVVMMSLGTNNTKVPYLKIRTYKDITLLSSTIAKVPIVISGFLADPAGVDSNYEYIQCLATEDINFAQTPFSVVTNNNAGTSTPTGYLAQGWATGGMRTYKINLTSGSVSKGTFFYVGGIYQNVNGKGSAPITNRIWYGYDYNKTVGNDFGTATSNLLANSGNAFGIAIFKGTKVVESSEPIDVVFVSNGGSLYSAGPPAKGYRITNTDFFDKINPITLALQPYYLAGGNTRYAASHPSGVTDPFFKLRGVFNVSLGRWTTARNNIFVSMSGATSINMLEDSTATRLVE